MSHVDYEFTRTSMWDAERRQCEALAHADAVDSCRARAGRVVEVRSIGARTGAVGACRARGGSAKHWRTHRSVRYCGGATRWAWEAMRSIGARAGAVDSR